jgi:hypothetical protein
MRIDEIANFKGWEKSIVDSMVLTIIDPKLPGARMKDCYSSCARAIRNGGVPDSSDFLIMGVKDLPAHGVIVDGDNVIVDSYSSKRTGYDNGELTYSVFSEPLTEISRISVGDIKDMARVKYSELTNR